MNSKFDPRQIHVLANGARVRFRPLSFYVEIYAQRRYPFPDIPEVETEEGWRVENPDDPAYRRSVIAVAKKRSDAGNRAKIMLGIELVDPIPDDGEWLPELEFLGLIPDDYDGSDPIQREFLYKEHYTVGATDLQLFSDGIGLSERSQRYAMSYWKADQGDGDDPDRAVVLGMGDNNSRDHVLFTGVRIRPKQVSVQTLQRARSMIVDPSVPKQYDPETDTWLENELHPAYERAVALATQKRDEAENNALLLLGVGLVDPIPPDDTWVKRLVCAGVLDSAEFASDLDRRLIYTKLLAVSAMDMLGIIHLIGYSEVAQKQARRLFLD